MAGFAYQSNGNYGQVRLAQLQEQMQNTSLFSLSRIGWHCCNERYSIQRPNGDSRYLSVEKWVARRIGTYHNIA